MISIDYSNLFKLSGTHGISKSDIAANKMYLIQYRELIKAREQGFATIIEDTNMVKEVEAFAKSVQGKYDHIVVLGIGGSSLGTICLRDSLGHLFDADRTKRKHPRLHVMDNIDPTLILELEEVIDLKRTLFVVVSKSGTTPEILSQFMYFKNKLKKARLKMQDHMVFVTDPANGFLFDVAAKEQVTTFTIPKNVGGRFSVLTPVGLLPAALVGLPIKKLLKGAKSMRDSFFSSSYTKNIPFQIATIQYLLHNKGKSINVMMPYAQKMARFADWYRQLLAESIGKELNNQGKKVNVGITPINALGATDQHSQSQLYNEGPNDKFFMFITVNHLSKNVKIPSLYKKDDRTAFLDGVTFNELIATEHRATADSYTQNNRPNITINVEKIDAETIGGLFMLFEGATAFLGEYFKIDAFNQPGVELAKQLTKEYLE